MICGISGILMGKRANSVNVDVGGVIYKIYVSERVLRSLPAGGREVCLHTYLNVKEDALELFGFLEGGELDLFEQLIKVNGVGPRSALGVMAVAPVEQLAAAIIEGKSELLTRASGVGKKTAEKIILELKGKLAAMRTEETVKLMEGDLELEELLVGLGYGRGDARKAIAKLEKKDGRLEERLKAILKTIKS